MLYTADGGRLRCGRPRCVGDDEVRSVSKSPLQSSTCWHGRSTDRTLDTHNAPLLMPPRTRQRSIDLTIYCAT